MELIILMPCLNEAESVETCVRKVRRFLERIGIDGEILVAGSAHRQDQRRPWAICDNAA